MEDDKDALDGCTKLVQEVLKKHLENHLKKTKQNGPETFVEHDFLVGGNSHFFFLMFTPKNCLGKMKPF